ncbi:hypothetical protein ACWDSL_06580 [Streptomyces sp. NPDC000941]
MPRTIPLKHPLDAGLPCQAPAEPEPQTSPAAVADLSHYHHPHFVRSEPGRYDGWVNYFFTAFTGREPEPKMPESVYDDKAVTYEQRRELSSQYDAARIMWSKARLRLQAGPLLREAAPLWDAWTTAQAELRATFKAFWETSDGQWRAQLLRLTDAERDAKVAATAWDELAEKLAKLASEQVYVAGEYDELGLTTVAKDIGLDASRWWIDHISAYRPDSYFQRETPLVQDVTREIEKQREQLREIATLAGDSDPAHRALA